MTTGDDLRSARRAAGLSLAAMARLLPWSKAALGFYETGQRRVPDGVAEAYRRVTTAAGSERTVNSGIHRRTLLSLSASVPGMIMMAGSSAGRSGIGTEDLTQLEELADLQRRWKEYSSGALQLRSILTQAEDLAELGRIVRQESTRRRVYRILARFAHNAAAIFWDIGHEVNARACYELAVRSYREALDRTGEANAFTALARQELEMRRDRSALELTTRALDLLGHDASPALRAKALSRHAWAYANLGDLDGFLRAARHAEEVHARGDEHAASGFDRAELAGVLGGRLVVMARRTRHQAHQAVQYIEKAVELRSPDRINPLVLDHIGLSEAYLINSDLDAACVIGHHAADLAEKTDSVRVMGKLKELARRMPGTERNALELKDRVQLLTMTNERRATQP